MPSDQPHTHEIFIKSALHYHDNEMPCNWDVNVYRGCGHGCRYCFAQYSHEYLDSGDFFRDIFVKRNVAEILDRELSKKSWKKNRINLAGVTDAYQPLEAKIKLMPAVLKVLIKHRNPVVITTKSALILRDIDLIRQLASVTSVSIGSSITMMDEKLQKLLEPGASSPAERFRVLEECRDAGCWTNILATPVLPFITDSFQNLEEIYKNAALVRVNGLSVWPLNLRGNTKGRFFDFLRKHFPSLLPEYQRLFTGWTINKEYSEDLRKKALFLRNKYVIPGIHLPPDISEKEDVQLSLF
jgi:DNA repair photolyase